jgi:hypothetical protein
LPHHYQRHSPFASLFAAKLEVASKKTCSGTSIADLSATRMLLIVSLLLTGLTNLLHIQHDVRGII